MIVTHEWEGERNNSTSIRKVNGVINARNLNPNPIWTRTVGTRFHEYKTRHILEDYVGQTVLVSMELKADFPSGFSTYPYQANGISVNRTMDWDLTEEWRRVFYTGPVVDLGSNPSWSTGGIAVYGSADSSLRGYSRNWMFTTNLEIQEYFDGDTPDYSTNTLKVYSEGEWQEYTPKVYI